MNKIYINKIVSIVLSLLIFTLPLGFSKVFLQPQTGQFILFLSLIGIILFVGAYYLIFKPNKSIISISIIDILLLIFVITSIFLQWYENQSNDFLLELAGLSIVYFIAQNSKSKLVTPLFFVFIFAGFIQATNGLLQLLDLIPSNHSQFQVTGSFNNPGPLAGYLASVLPFSVLILWLTLVKKQHPSTHILSNITAIPFFKKIFPQNKWIIIFVVLLSAVTILFMIIVTKSRAAGLAVIGSISFMILQLNKLTPTKKKQSWKIQIKKLNLKSKSIQFLVSVIVMVLVCFASVGLYQIKKNSADGRLLIWNVTSNMIMDKPLFGHGVNGFQANYMEYQADYFEANPKSDYAPLADNNIYVFNEFIRIASEHGIIGLLLVGGILYYLLFGKTKEGLETDEILLFVASKAGLLAILIFSFFSYPLEVLPIKLNLVLFIAIIVSFQKPVLKFQIKQTNKNIWLRRIVGVCIIGFSIFLISDISKMYTAQKHWKLGYTAYKLGAYKNSLKYFENAEPVLHSHGEFQIQYAKALFFSRENGKAIIHLMKAKKYLPNSIVYTTLGDYYKNIGEFDLAERAYLRASFMVPGRFYPKYLLAKLYVENENTEEAVKIANELLNKKVKIESKAILEIKEEMKKIVESSNQSLSKTIKK